MGSRVAALLGRGQKSGEGVGQCLASSLSSLLAVRVSSFYVPVFIIGASFCLTRAENRTREKVRSFLGGTGHNGALLAQLAGCAVQYALSSTNPAFEAWEQPFSSALLLRQPG